MPLQSVASHGLIEPVMSLAAELAEIAGLPMARSAKTRLGAALHEAAALAARQPGGFVVRAQVTQDVLREGSTAWRWYSPRPWGLAGRKDGTETPNLLLIYAHVCQMLGQDYQSLYAKCQQDAGMDASDIWELKDLLNDLRLRSQTLLPQSADSATLDLLEADMQQAGNPDLMRALRASIKTCRCHSRCACSAAATSSAWMAQPPGSAV